MCRIFSIIRKAAVDQFPGQYKVATTLYQLIRLSVCLSDVDQANVVQYTAVSAFVFLRLFAPAILNPKLFGLRPEYAVSSAGIVCIMMMSSCRMWQWLEH